jgi:PKD repeat protein
VSFTDQSTGNITNRFWDFGDGSSTNTVTTDLTHSYVDAGSYAITLTVSGPFGVSTLKRTDYIVVNAPLLITDIQVSGPNVVISFSSSPNQFYQLEYIDTWTPAVWNPAVGSIPGNGGTVTVTHFGGATRVFRFYRIRQLP